MKLTNNKLEQLIIEVLNENKNLTIDDLDTALAFDGFSPVVFKRQDGSSNFVAEDGTKLSDFISKENLKASDVNFRTTGRKDFAGDKLNPTLYQAIASGKPIESSTEKPEEEETGNQEEETGNQEEETGNQEEETGNQDEEEVADGADGAADDGGLTDFKLNKVDYVKRSNFLGGDVMNYAQDDGSPKAIKKRLFLSSALLKPESTEISDEDKIRILVAIHSNWNSMTTHHHDGKEDEAIDSEEERQAIVLQYLNAFFDHDDEEKQKLAIDGFRKIGMPMTADKILQKQIAKLPDFQFKPEDVISKEAPADGPLAQAIGKVFTTPPEVKDFAGLYETILKEVEESTEVKSTDVVDLGDFGAALLSDDDDMKRKVIRVIRIANNLGPDDPQVQALNSLVKYMQMPGARAKIDPTASTADVVSSTPTLDLGDMYGADRKEVPRYIVDLFNGIQLDELPTIKERISRINELTKQMFKGGDEVNQTISETVSSVAVVEVMGKIVRQFDAKSAGWVFESFLAQLANGTTEGALLGAADFSFGLPPDVTDPTKKGSAKLLQKDEFSQAVSTMKDVFKEDGDSMTYILGVKKGPKGGTQASYDAGTLQPTGVKTAGTVSQVTIYKISLTKKGDSMKHTLGITSNDATISREAVGSTDSIVMRPTVKPIGTLYLGFNQAELEKAGKEALEQQLTQLPELFNKLNVFNQKTQSYLAGDRKESAIDSLRAYVDLKDLINTVFEAKAQETGVTATGGEFITGTPAVGLSESIRTLDQLIAEAMRDIKKE